MLISYKSKLKLGSIALCSFGVGMGVMLSKTVPLSLSAVVVLAFFWLLSIICLGVAAFFCSGWNCVVHTVPRIIPAFVRR